MATKKLPDYLETHTIELDGEWLMAEFSEFFHQYTQVYSFCAAVVPQEMDNAGLGEILTRYPWKGGYSVVNFYNDLDRLLGRRARPQVQSIKYASPGAMEIAALVGVAATIRTLVDHFVKSGESLNQLYNEIRRGMMERKLLALDVKEKEQRIRQRDLEFAKESFQELAGALELPGSERLLETSPNSVAALKVLLSFHRRLRKLAEFEEKGKAKL